MKAKQVCCESKAVYAKNLVSSTDVPKMQTLTLLKSQKTTRYCWSFCFHATRLLLLRWILEIFEPSTTTYARHYFWHLGDDQQYPPILLT